MSPEEEQRKAQVDDVCRLALRAQALMKGGIITDATKADTSPTGTYRACETEYGKEVVLRAALVLLEGAETLLRETIGVEAIEGETK